MKYGYQQILAYLHAFNKQDVEKAFEIWKSQSIEADFRMKGWFPIDEKPTDREFFEFGGKYWIQDRKKHLQQVKEELRRRGKQVNFDRIKKRVAANYDPIKTELYLTH